MKVLLLLVGILLHVSLQVSAVEMFEGEFILMSCEFPTHEVDQATVVWTRSDLSPSIVHQRQTDGDELKDQNQLYRGRTFMKPDALETGDLSLNLTKLQVSDTGTYTCTVRTSKGERQVTDIELLVKERFPSWAIALLVLLVLVLIVSAALLYHFWPVLQVVVNSGVQSVLLPCRTAIHLTRDVKVEWKDEDNRMVHVYKKGSNQSEGQDQVYKDRTKMNKNALRTGDFSLTLKHPTDEDSETYTCTVYDSKEKEVLKEKKVNLLVKVPKVVVTSGEKSFLLPCKTNVDLPGDAKVEWTDGRDWKVHVYENGSDQPEDQYWFYRARTKINKDPLKTGDFSLTLDHPTDKDTEIYTCTTYDKERKILMKKQVKVKVKVPQVVAVNSEEESFLLPCRPTDDLPGDVRVEWTDSRDKKVHVYKDGSDHPEEQNVFYSNRTVMDKDPLRTKDPLTTKDFSLTLKYPTDGDSNIYTCTVYDSKEKVLMKKQVQLKVKVCQVEVGEEAESVKLPFQTAPGSLEDIKVEWRNRDGKMVHLYMKGSDQPGKQNQHYINRTKMNEDLVKTGDLSLTLTRPTKEDRGEYKCTVWTKGKVLRWKTFHLIIKAKTQAQPKDQPEDQPEGIPLLSRESSDPGPTR